MYGMANAGDYTLGLMYTFPHRFWTITGQQTNLVEITDDDSLHLMVSLADAQTGTTIPADVRITVEGENTDVTPSRGQLWPMITQTMGFTTATMLLSPRRGPTPQPSKSVRSPPAGQAAWQDGSSNPKRRSSPSSIVLTISMIWSFPLLTKSTGENGVHSI